MSEKVESHSGVHFHHSGEKKAAEAHGSNGRTFSHQRHNSESALSCTSSTTDRRSDARNGNFREGRLVPSRVFVGNIPPNLSEQDLAMLFVRFGKIRDVKIISEHNVRNKSYGFVTFWTEEDARGAIQACMNHENVMWGDRKLNVAPAFKRSVCHPSMLTLRSSTDTRNGSGTTFYPANPLHASTPTLFTGSTEAIQQPLLAIEPMVPIEPVNSPMCPTAVYCRMPAQQFAMSPCNQYAASSNGHYCMAPGLTHCIQSVNQPPASYGTTYAAVYGGQDGCKVGMPLLPSTPHYQFATPPTPPTTPKEQSSSANSTVDSSDSSTADTITDCLSECDNVDSHASRQEKVVDQEMTIHDSGDINLQHQSQQHSFAPFPQSTMLCCAHHSCMMNPISPVPPLVSQPAVGLTRSCLSLHPATANTTACFAPNAPLIAYNAPMVYGSRRGPNRLQRWNSVDTHLGTFHNQHQALGLWGHESSWVRSSMNNVNDVYASDPALYTPRQQHFDRMLRPTFTYQPQVPLPPYCRSYELHPWVQAQQQPALNSHLHYQHHTEMTEQGHSAAAAAAAAAAAFLSGSNLSLDQLNLNEIPVSEHAHQHSIKKQ